MHRKRELSIYDYLLWFYLGIKTTLWSNKLYRIQWTIKHHSGTFNFDLDFGQGASTPTKNRAMVVAQLVEWLLWHQRSAVQIRSLANFIYYQVYWNCVEIKKKRTGTAQLKKDNILKNIGPFLKKDCSSIARAFWRYVLHTEHHLYDFP